MDKLFYFLNGKVFTSPEQLYQEIIIPHSCLQIRSGSQQAPKAGYITIKYIPWQENPFSDISRQVVTLEKSELLIEAFMKIKQQTNDRGQVWMFNNAKAGK